MQWPLKIECVEDTEVRGLKSYSDVARWKKEEQCVFMLVYVCVCMYANTILIILCSNTQFYEKSSIMECTTRQGYHLLSQQIQFIFNFLFTIKSY